MLHDTSGEAALQPIAVQAPESQAGQTYLALHTLGWKAFQDLCSQVCEVVLNRVVAVYREAQDGGQDATFTSPCRNGPPPVAATTIQCKFVSEILGSDSEVSPHIFSCPQCRRMRSGKKARHA